MTLIPYRPEKPAVVRWTYETDILKMRDGTEQRIALKGYPRETYELTYILSEEEMRQVRTWLLYNPDQEFQLPLFHEEIPLRSTLSTTTFQIDTTYADWLVDGRSVLVTRPDGEYHLSTLNGTAANSGVETITLDDAVSVTFTAGRAMVCPVVTVYLEDRSVLGRHPTGAGVWRVRARAAAVGAPYGTGAGLTSYNARYVMTKRITANSVVNEQTFANMELLDDGYAIEPAWHQNQADIHRSFQIGIRGAADRQWAKKFVHELRGMQKAFYCPTWCADLVAAQTHIPPIGPVVWQNVVGAEAFEDGSLKKTAALGWGNSGASSIQTIQSGVAGYVEYVIRSNTYTGAAYPGNYALVGLSNGDTDQTFNDVDFGLYVYPTQGRLYVVQGGAFPTYTTYAEGDTIRVSVSAGGTVTYQKNGVTFYTSLLTPTFPLRVDTALYNPGAKIDEVIISTGVSGTALRIEGPPTANAIDYVADWWPDTTHRLLQLMYDDDTIEYVTVTAAVDNMDGTQTLTISPASDRTISMISFLELSRLADDEITFTYGNDGRDYMEISLYVVQQ